MRLKLGTIGRFFRDPKDNFFLFGARGTGKSTWLNQNYPSAFKVDLLKPEVLLSYLGNPEQLRNQIEGQPDLKVVILDEVQKAPKLLDVVHELIESKPNLKFILTGSSARKLKQAGVDLLGGRTQICSMQPFMGKELGKHFKLEEALHRGMLPVIVTSANPIGRLKAYLALYMREEVQQEGLVRNVAGFSRFLEAISFSHGSLINSSNIAIECRVDRKTVDAYIQILEDLLLAYRITAFRKRAKRQVVEHMKFYLLDAGVFRSLRPKGPLDRTEEIEGIALEGLVFQHLVAWNAYSENEHSLHFWKTRSGVEVDFIVYGPKTFVAIEVKNSAKLTKHDLSPLNTFSEEYPEATLILLYRGHETLKIGNVWCTPVEQFLMKLDPANPIKAIQP
jgi:predicted AAA+ superfamily ATPase